jgi:hypothetical protein
MLLYMHTWLPLVTITLTAAIFFGVASLWGMQSLSDDRRTNT